MMGCIAISVGVLAAMLGLAYVALLGGRDPAGEQWREKHSGLVGTNLGGWLVLERWLVGRDQTSVKYGPIASPFDGISAPCEHSLTQVLRERGELHKLDDFRDKFVTREDLTLIRQSGANAIRVPFGYWIAVEDEAHAGGYHMGRGLGYLDDAMAWAEAEGLKIILDLHGAPGGQSGEQTCGCLDGSWTPERFDHASTLRVLRTVAQRYCGRRALIAIELLNEPALPMARLLPFYREAFAAVRDAGCSAEEVAIVVNLYPVPNVLLHGWYLNMRMPPSSFPNVVWDVHLYYSFLPLALHSVLSLQTLTQTFVDVQSAVLALTGRGTVVGEWSLKLPFQGPIAQAYHTLALAERTVLHRAFGERQLAAMARRRLRNVGHFFWTWNAPVHEAPWSLRTALQSGWLRLGEEVLEVAVPPWITKDE